MLWRLLLCAPWQDALPLCATPPAAVAAAAAPRPQPAGCSYAALRTGRRRAGLVGGLVAGDLAGVRAAVLRARGGLVMAPRAAVLGVVDFMAGGVTAPLLLAATLLDLGEVMGCGFDGAGGSRGL